MLNAIKNQTLSGERKKKRGFTLTEIAIVLGIIGLILGAIWVAAGAVYQNLRVSKAQTELLQITQGIRSLYASQSVVDAAAATSETAALIAAKVFPSDTINGATVEAPWVNSTIVVFSATQPGGVTGDSFQIKFVGIPQAGCVSLATNSTGTGRDSALVTVDIAANAVAAYAAPTYATFPITAPVAVGLCTGATDTIAFTFALRG